ncbi:MAG: 3,4-dihydroxy-2-butanone-4-phosphate synthase [Gammaproteobacteria bacterium]
MDFDSIDNLIHDIRAGRMAIMVDEDQQRMEGQLVMAADMVRPEDVNFMTRFARGVVSLAITRARCQQLQLPLMVRDGHLDDGSRSTVSIEAARGVTTGISAADRAHTIRTAIARDARPLDVVQPGHVFPLLAQPGGVLDRAGYAEAAVDLARLAGREPAGVVVDILDESGAIADGDALTRLADAHDLRIGSITSLIEYRMRHEMTVRRAGECTLPTEFGEFRLVLYRETLRDAVHIALFRGDIDPRCSTLVRVHVENPLCDLTGSLRGDCGWPLRDVLRRIGLEGGVAVVLRGQIEAEDMVQQVLRYAGNTDALTAPLREPVRTDLRVIGLGAQILVDLGVRRMRVLSSPRRFHGLSGFGLEVVEHVT